MAANRLAREKSPYLLQHAHNPVDWYPWGEEAFEKARREDKPIFLSIGYSTCHWCHVMERESFESEETAAILNRYFVPVKVDREERPDVDRVYMAFVQAATGSGGWPMSVWLTPDLKAFYGGTYFPPENRFGRPSFRTVLEHLAAAWQSNRRQIVDSSRQIFEELAKLAAGAAGLAPAALPVAERCFLYFRRSFDAKYGGFGGAPKFPRPASLHFLLRYFAATGEPEALEMALATLDGMARGGMHDHVGGGFHRYSVDERWFVPHFEKMLYDQAQLAMCYLEAFQICGDSGYADVAAKTLDYVLRDMTDPEGGFYSAEDADSPDPDHPEEKAEGAFYLWRQEEVAELAGAQHAAWFAHRYGLEPGGNVHHDPAGEFAGKNILYEAQSAAETASQFGVPERDVIIALEEVLQRLFERRGQRPRPRRDDKVLTAWNGLMISALAKAAQVFANSAPERAARYLAAAVRSAEFVQDRLGSGPADLYRRYRDGQAAIAGFLEDYAFFAQALLDLFETTFEPRYIDWAAALVRRQRDLFEDRHSGGFFSTPESAGDVILRLKDDYDGAEPSGNSVSVSNLIRLARLTGDARWNECAQRALGAFAGQLNGAPPMLPQMVAALLAAAQPPQTVVVVGYGADPAAQALLAAARRRFLPFAQLVLLPPDESALERQMLTRWMPWLKEMRPIEGKAAAYVCENYACQLPVTNPDHLVELLK